MFLELSWRYDPTQTKIKMDIGTIDFSRMVAEIKNHNAEIEVVQIMR